MQAFVLRNGVWQPSQDRAEIEQAMPHLQAGLARLAEQLSEADTEEEVNRKIEEINYWLGIWNTNIEVLNKTSKLQAIAEARKIIAGLKWPAEAAASA